MLVIQQDTRDKPDKHLNLTKGFENCGIKVIRSKNTVGDYIIPSSGNVSVDMKQDMLEITNNLLSDHYRFASECKLAKILGIKLYVLIEEPTSFGELMTSYKYQTKKNGEAITKANPATVAKIMMTMQEKYGVRFVFTDKKTSPIKVCLLLGISYEYLISNCKDEKLLAEIKKMYWARKGRKK